MNEINNMGGIVFARLLFVDQITLFSIINNQVLIRVQTNPKNIELPIVNIAAAPVVTPEPTDAGTLYKISATIRLPRAVLGDIPLHLLRTINSRGCVLLYQDACGYNKIVGAKEYPLFGTLTEINGSKPTDFSGCEIALSGKTLHPQLPYITP